jgi:hypothetical protein
MPGDEHGLAGDRAWVDQLVGAHFRVLLSQQGEHLGLLFTVIRRRRSETAGTIAQRGRKLRSVELHFAGREELGSQPSSIPPPHEGKTVGQSNGNGSSNGRPRLRDKLCLLILKYELDHNLVKHYAADFCGTQALRDAGRDLVEAFVSTVGEEAAKDRAGLLCKLNS